MYAVPVQLIDSPKILTLFFTMFPFDPSENIRKPKIPLELQVKVFVYVRLIAPESWPEGGDISQFFAPEQLIQQESNSIVLRVIQSYLSNSLRLTSISALEQLLYKKS